MNNFFLAGLVVAVLSSASSGLSAGLSDGRESAQITEGSGKAAPEEAGPLTRSQSLLKIILDEKADIRDRLEATDDLGELNASEITALYGFLRDRSVEGGSNIGGIRTLKNNIINSLKAQTKAPAGLTATLVEVYRDRSQDFVMRDYAIQHLSSWYERSETDSVGAKDTIRAVLGEALSEKSSLAGTALLGLHGLSEVDRNIDAAEIDRNALRMALSSTAPQAARITAIQICAERRINQALPVIERLAKTGGEDALRVSAIAALGTIGSVKDAAFLQRLSFHGDPVVQAAAVSALKRMTRAVASREAF